METVEECCQETRQCMAGPHAAFHSVVDGARESTLGAVELSAFFFDRRFGGPNIIVCAKEGPDETLEAAFKAFQRMGAEGRVTYAGNEVRPLHLHITQHDDRTYRGIAGQVAAFLRSAYPGRCDGYAQRLEEDGFLGENIARSWNASDYEQVFGRPPPLIDPSCSLPYNLLDLMNRIEQEHPGIPRIAPIWDLAWLEPLSGEPRAAAVERLRTPQRFEDVLPEAAVIHTTSAILSLRKREGRGRPHIIAAPLYPYDAVGDHIGGAEWARMGAGDELLDELRGVPMYHF